ncbi:MarR family winged helix-turn-helix transcriptional regulator [Mumia sp. DW29H23]|uniref:MarR family winged helix-turn-helix transcriptional regulator n=1 Tax=Mumia sp. DW29H23 TaxID=3421241 RepID=UPI003D69ED1B
MDSLPSVDRTDVRFMLGMQLRELLRLAPSVHARLAAEIGIGVTDALALDHAMASLPDPMGVGDLAHRLGIRSASATVAVDRLVSSGHMERTPHPTDRRRTSLQPTDSAYADARRASAPLVTAIRELTGDLDDESAARVHAFLEQAILVLRNYADHVEPVSPQDPSTED